MPSNTPLPAAQLLALADAAVFGHCEGCGDWVSIQHGLDSHSVTVRDKHGDPYPQQCGPIHYSAEAEAYRAARASSPVTLEEDAIPEWASTDLVKKLLQAATIWADEHSMSPNAVSINEQDWRGRVLDLSYRLGRMKYEHARTIAAKAAKGDS